MLTRSHDTVSSVLAENKIALLIFNLQDHHKLRLHYLEPTSITLSTNTIEGIPCLEVQTCSKYNWRRGCQQRAFPD